MITRRRLLGWIVKAPVLLPLLAKIPHINVPQEMRAVQKKFTWPPEHPRCRCAMIREASVDGMWVDEEWMFTKQDLEALVRDFRPATSREEGDECFT